MFVVDTNVLVYAADEDSPYHQACRSALEGWRANASAWYVTWPILYEFLRVVTHPRVLRSPRSAADAWRFVSAIASSPSLTVLSPGERHREVLAATLEQMPFVSGNLMHDVHTAVLMREHGIRRIYTRDADFHRFTFLEAIDPVAS